MQTVATPIRHCIQQHLILVYIVYQLLFFGVFLTEMG